MPTVKLLTTKESAERLGVTVQRVHALIKAKRLPAEKMGRDYFIRESDLKLIADRKPGRPPKADRKKGGRAVSNTGSEPPNGGSGKARTKKV
jgi:excisionase family DNA binding protein